MKLNVCTSEFVEFFGSDKPTVADISADIWKFFIIGIGQYIFTNEQYSFQFGSTLAFYS